MDKHISATDVYKALVSDLETIKGSLRQDLLRAMSPIIIEAYWKMGKRIALDALVHEEKKSVLFARIARDLDMEPSLLSRMVKLYRLWPKGAPTKEFPYLTWSHYKLLMSVRAEEERAFYARTAAADHWKVSQLKERISHDYFALNQQMRSDGDDYRGAMSRLERNTVRLHLYSAMLEKVVDGDTLILFIDLGFDVWRSQRVRLRGIDAPERNTPAGERAKVFVEEKMRGNRRVVVQTFRIDIYGRYVGDVFYLLGEKDKERIAREGNFLNQEIVDGGFARLIG
jgi:endonuclease YncB( thermonuclease family)